MKVRAQPASPVALASPDEKRRGKGRSEPGPAAHTRSLLVGGGAAERGSSTTSNRAGEGRRKSGLITTATDSETPPRPHLPGNSPPPSPAHSQPQPRAAAWSPPPRPAVRPCGPQSARGRRPGVVRTKPLPRRLPCFPATPGGRRRRGGGGGGGVLLSCPLSSPELAPNVRARWSEAATKVVLPRCAARAERGQGRSPTPGGTWRTPDSPAGQRSVRLVFWLLRIGRPAQPVALPPGFLLPLRPGGRCVPHCDLEARDPSPDPDYRGVSPGQSCCSVSLRRLSCSRFRRERWPGSNPGGGRTCAALCGEL